jgi:membrane fusion protein (multidrug efflux system)
VGQIVGPGTTVATIVGVGGNYFEGEVPESEITKVSVGKSVSIKVSALGSRTFSGHVAGINPQGTDVGRLFRVRISIDSATSELKPGMFATGVITLAVYPNAVVVPSSAITSFQEQQGVWVMNGSDSVKFLPIQTGLRKNDEVQVISGLSPGEKLVVKGQVGLNPKSKVRIDDGKGAPVAQSTTKGS